MRTITLDLSEKDFKKYDFESEEISFEDFVEKIRNTLARDALKKCQEMAALSDLSRLTLTDINKEVRTVRNAKNRH